MPEANARPGLHRQPCPRDKILHANGHPHGKRAAQPSTANTQSAQAAKRKSGRQSSPLLSSPLLFSPLLSSPHLGAVAEVECGFASNVEILSALCYLGAIGLRCFAASAGPALPCPALQPPCQPTHQGASLFCSKCVLPLLRTHAIHLFVPFLPSSLPSPLLSSFLLEPLQVRAEFIRTPPPFNW
jgi:hypothetical protein